MTSHSAVTRDALESSSPKLREMLGAQGFGQVSVDISQRSFQERSALPVSNVRGCPGRRAARLRHPAQAGGLCLRALERRASMPTPEAQIIPPLMEMIWPVM